MGKCKKVFSLVLVFIMLFSCISVFDGGSVAAKTSKKKGIIKTSYTYSKGGLNLYLPQVKYDKKRSYLTYEIQNPKIATFSKEKRKIVYIKKDKTIYKKIQFIKIHPKKIGKTKIVVRKVWKKKYYNKKKMKNRSTIVEISNIKIVKAKVYKPKFSENKAKKDISVEAMNRSVLSTGNNYRIKRAIEKARNGEPVTIAYLGGSVTEGIGASDAKKTSYAYQSYEMFKKAFGKGDGSNVKIVNAGISGTPSVMGLIRYNRDVITPSGGEPDLLIVEYAMNDQVNDLQPGVTYPRQYESLIAQVLKNNKNTGVVSLFTVAGSGWNMEDDYMSAIGKYYDTPMISMKKAIVPEFQNGNLSYNDFYYDAKAHPTDVGHKIIAKCIENMFETIDKEAPDTDVVVPSQPTINGGQDFVGMEMIDSQKVPADVVIDKGSFTSTDTKLPVLVYAPTQKTFPNNWMYKGDIGGSQSFKMTVTGKNLLMLYKLNSLKGLSAKLDVYVDGIYVKTITSNYKWAWDNAYTETIFDNKTAGKHEVELKIASGCEKMDFSILGFGLTR